MDKKTLTALRDHFGFSEDFTIKSVHNYFCVGGVVLRNLRIILATFCRSDEVPAIMDKHLQDYEDLDMKIVFDSFIIYVVDINKTLHHYLFDCMFSNPFSEQGFSPWIKFKAEQKFLKKHKIKITPEEFLYKTAIVTGLFYFNFQEICENIDKGLGRGRPYYKQKLLKTLLAPFADHQDKTYKFLKSSTFRDWIWNSLIMETKKGLMRLTPEDEEYYINYLLKILHIYNRSTNLL